MALKIMHYRKDGCDKLDVVKVNYVHVDNKNKAFFYVTHRYSISGRELSRKIKEGDLVKVGNDAIRGLCSKEDVEQVYELMQEKLLGPEYVKLKAESKK